MKHLLIGAAVAVAAFGCISLALGANGYAPPGVSSYRDYDVNHNNLVNASDRTLVLQCAFEIEPCLPEHDVNGNGRANASDGTLVARCFFQIDPCPLFDHTQYVDMAGAAEVSTAMDFAPDGRIFVARKDGRILIVEDGAYLPDPFATFTVDTLSERGLVGLTLDPGFPNSPYVYVYYIVPGSHGRISRLEADGNLMASETPLMELPALTSVNGFHLGGGIHFGTDGTLYVALGNDVNNANSQSMDTVLGKIIRINADGSIPEDNPFYQTATADNRAIYALGFRNPFSFAVSADGPIHVNDVGETLAEEVNLLAPGGNYGWPICEGPCGPPNSAYIDPVYYYGRAEGRAITAGVFYDGTDLPLDHQGDYFFADYLTRWIKRLNGGTPETIETGGDQTIDLDVGPDGFLYSLALTNGRIYRHTLR